MPVFGVTVSLMRFLLTLHVDWHWKFHLVFEESTSLSRLVYTLGPVSLSLGWVASQEETKKKQRP